MAAAGSASPTARSSSANPQSNSTDCPLFACYAAALTYLTAPLPVCSPSGLRRLWMSSRLWPRETSPRAPRSQARMSLVLIIPSVLTPFRVFCCAAPAFISKLRRKLLLPRASALLVAPLTSFVSFCFVARCSAWRVARLFSRCESDGEPRCRFARVPVVCDRRGGSRGRRRRRRGRRPIVVRFWLRRQGLEPQRSEHASLQDHFAAAARLTWPFLTLFPAHSPFRRRFVLCFPVSV